MRDVAAVSESVQSNHTPPPAVASPERLRALVASRLLEAPAEEEFDRLTRLLCRLLGVPVALITVVDAARQHFVSQQGLAEPWASERGTPLSHSFCQYVVGDGKLLQVEDARRDERLRDNLAIEDLGVVSYLGVPLRDAEGNVLGAVCAIDGTPRQWSPDDIQALDLIATLAASEIALREALRRAEAAADQMQRLNTTLEARVAERTAEVERLAQALTVAEEDERARLARVLHDELQQILYGARLQIGNGPLATEELAHVSGLLNRAAGIARSLSHDLAPTVPEGASLRDALRALARYGHAVYRLDVSVETDDVPLPGRPLQLLVGRVVKELLFNVAKHAGVQEAQLTGRACPAAIEIAVADDGRGFDARSREGGIGLTGVRERVRLFGGTVDVESAPGNGTTVRVTLPQARRS